MKAALFEVGQSALGELIDEYGKVDLRVRQFQPTADRHENLKRQLKAMLDSKHPAEESFVESGLLFALQVGAKQNERKVRSMSAVAKALGGLKGLLTACTVSISVLEERLGKSGAAALLVEDRTGSRRLKVVSLGGGGPEAA